MNEPEKNKNELGTYVDVKIGKEDKENSSQHSKADYFEEEMLKMSRRQTEYLRQIKSIATYFFFLSIISIVIAIISIFN